jgi:hypothetical protein
LFFFLDDFFGRCVLGRHISTTKAFLFAATKDEGSR